MIVAPAALCVRTSIRRRPAGPRPARPSSQPARTPYQFGGPAALDINNQDTRRFTMAQADLVLRSAPGDMLEGRTTPVTRGGLRQSDRLIWARRYLMCRSDERGHLPATSAIGRDVRS